MADAMKLAIELVLKGGAQVTAGIENVTKSVRTIGREFQEGVVDGMNKAVRDAERPMKDLKKMADEARKALEIRSDIQIQDDIDKARKAYDDLKSSGQATASELNRAKDSMKSKIGELRVEMGKWSGSWEDLGKKATEVGQKMQAIGAKMARKKLMLSGVSPRIGNHWFRRGSSAAAENRRLAGFCSPSGIMYLTIRKFISDAAMKLNMMVVTTTWLPRFACR